MLLLLPERYVLESRLLDDLIRGRHIRFAPTQQVVGYDGRNQYLRGLYRMSNKGELVVCRVVNLSTNISRVGPWTVAYGLQQ